MMIEKIEIKKENDALHGQLKFIDSDLTKEDTEEMVSRLVSWKLGPVKPTRHFEMVYNKDEVRAEVEVFVSMVKPLHGQVEDATYIFSKLMDFLNHYRKDFDKVKGSL